MNIIYLRKFFKNPDFYIINCISETIVFCKTKMLVRRKMCYNNIFANDFVYLCDEADISCIPSICTDADFTLYFVSVIRWKEHILKKHTHTITQPVSSWHVCPSSYISV